MRLERLLHAKAGELSLACLSFAYFFFLLSGYYILRPLRDEMGIQGGVANLPWLFTGTFLVILSAVPIYAAVASRFPPRRFVPWVYRFFNANLLLFWILFLFTGIQRIEWVARAFFIWTSVFNLFVVSVFWSFMVDIFKKEQADRLFGFIAGGGTLGALAGPLVTIGLVQLTGTTHLLLISCVLLEGAVFCIRQILKHAGKKETEVEPVGGNVLSGIGIVFRSPYLLMICLYIFLMTSGSTFLYFTQAEIISGALRAPAERTQVFAMIDFGVNILTLAVQTFLTGRIITRLGLAFALSVLPAATAGALVTLAAAPVLGFIVLFQVIARALRYSLTQPAREILFTRVSREEKYKSKNFIDTVVYRGGDATSAWIFQGFRALGESLPVQLLIGALMALVWLGLGIFLGKKHEQMKSPSSPVV